MATPALPSASDDANSATPKLDYDNPTAIRYLPTTDAYNLWASVYDTDGNFLQALDSIEMTTLFPQLLDRLKKTPKPWKLVDLGCGTGRNTVALLGVPDAEVVAVDASEKMLERAKERIAEIKGHRRESEVQFGIIDLLAEDKLPDLVNGADGVVSTLVLEHIPCEAFFRHVSQILKPSGWLLLTNMHSHMGGISQAGFVDATTGEKIRPTSYAHTVQEVVSEGSRWGLRVDGQMEERKVDEELSQSLGVRSKKWIDVWCWYGGLFQKS